MEGIRYITSASKDSFYQDELYFNLFGEFSRDKINQFYYLNYDYRLENQEEFNRRFEKEFANQVLLGKWSDSDDRYYLSEFAEMTTGILPAVSVAQAIRDTSYDLNVWDSNAELKDYFVIGLDALGAVELIKGGKNVFKFVKKSDNIVRISKVADIGSDDILRLSDNIVGSANIGTNIYAKEGLADVLTAADSLPLETKKLIANPKGIVQYDNILTRILANKKAKISELTLLDSSQLQEAEKVFLETVDQKLKAGYNLNIDDINEILDDCFDDVIEKAKDMDNLTYQLIKDSSGNTPKEKIYTKVGKRWELAPNNEYVLNGYNYKTGDNGEIVSASGSLKSEMGTRNNYAQQVAGREDRIRDKLNPDDGGHIFATIFNGSGDLANLVPMNRNLNRGQWEVMESYWDELLHNPQIADVSVEIKLNYPSNGGKRPESFTITTKVTGKNGKTGVYDTKFVNKMSSSNHFEKFDLEIIIN